MAAAESSKLNELIFIKRVKKAHHEESHGGAWKIAYADFVTAMMAFFLLMWLLNATTEEQRTAISNYFAPASVSMSTSGSGGVLGGRTINEDGAMAGSGGQPGIILGIPEPAEEAASEDGKEGEEGKGKTGASGGEENGNQSGAEGAKGGVGDGVPGSAGSADAGDAAAPGDAAASGLSPQEADEARLQAAGNALRQAIDSDPLLSAYRENLHAEVTLAGLRVQLLDSDDRDMYPMGSAEPLPHTKQILARLAAIIQGLPNKIAISGHTDSVPFRASTGYSNWELSTDRAHAGRRALIEAGLPEDRVVHVAGKASAEPFVKADPEAPQNRRISILLMRETPPARKETTVETGASDRPAAAPAAITDGADAAAGHEPDDAAAPAHDPFAEELWKRIN